MKPTILLINGSPSGPNGNTGSLLKVAQRVLAPDAQVMQLVLATETDTERILELLSLADGFVFATGTYWDSWGSPLQHFLEDFTEKEGTPLWLGKPASVLVTMHSVGGKGILSRLQGVLSSQGLLIPPMSGMVYSEAGKLALQADASVQNEDIWCLEDIAVVCRNLCVACSLPRAWSTWAVDRHGFMGRWID